MTLDMCFTETLVTACTVFEILAQIDHQGPNWTFLNLKMTFRVIPHLSCEQDRLHNIEAILCNTFGEHFATTG